MKVSGPVVVLAPSFGPAVVSLFGVEVPVLALGLSIAALLLARWIAPPPLRLLAKREQWMLTALLLIFLFLGVTGHLPLVAQEKPMGPGMAVVFGTGLGFSGLFVVEMAEKRVRAMIEAAFGTGGDKK